MEERLARLETAHRTLRRWTGALVVALAVVLLVAAIPQDAQANDRPPSTVPNRTVAEMEWEMYTALVAAAATEQRNHDFPGTFGTFGREGHPEPMLLMVRKHAKEAVDFYNR